MKRKQSSVTIPLRDGWRRIGATANSCGNGASVNPGKIGATTFKIGATVNTTEFGVIGTSGITAQFGECPSICCFINLYGGHLHALCRFNSF